MARRAVKSDALNCFALVAYIPDPLGRFLDDLRRELVPRCSPRAHVTVLPPRPIGGEVGPATDYIRSLVAEHPPFGLEAAQVEVFPKTDVVYLEIGDGQEQLRRMHRAMNVGPFEFHEPFSFHPHITLAQEIAAEDSGLLAGVARARWAAFPHRRNFPVETLIFVQARTDNTWVDLAECRLANGQPRMGPGEDLFSLVR